MKILFLQISDMHCVESDNNNYVKMGAVTNATRSLGKIDGIVVIFSGDLADRNTEKQYQIGTEAIDTLVSSLSREYNCDEIVQVIVPGNHDLHLTKDSRDIKAIEKWNLQEHLQEELDNMKQFFKVSVAKDCFVTDKICDVKTVNICGTNIQLCLLNSAPYSTLDKESKEVHYLPSYVEKKLSRNNDASIKISIMHHHYEWCEWNTKNMLKRMMDSDDITFFGHDHKHEVSSVKFSHGSSHNVIMGGEFRLDLLDNAAFNAIVYDTETAEFCCNEFEWSSTDSLFFKKTTFILTKKRLDLSPSADYLDSLLEDSNGISKRFTDYYVMPKLSVAGEAFSTENVERQIDEDVIFRALTTDKAIRITGNPGSGKTSLLRYLYMKSSEKGFVPLLIEKRDYRDSDIDKMIKSLFENQYKLNTEHAFERFSQVESSKKIIFIDDFDTIEHEKPRVKLFSTLLDRGYYIIYTTQEKDYDLEDIVKDKLEGKEISTITITPIYKEIRDQLIENVCKTSNKNDEYIQSVKTAFDYLVQCQTTFFDFTPGNILQYVQYFLNEGELDKREPQTLSVVFETNVRASLFKVCKESEAKTYLTALVHLAQTMYFDKKTEKLAYEDFVSLMSQYNSKRTNKINVPIFLEKCIQAHILQSSIAEADISFYDKNTYAYFVAKAISKEYENDATKTEKITYVMNHICFGINSSIIVFLSFIRENTRILSKLLIDAQELLENYPEWDFDKKNIPFLNNVSPMKDAVPTREESNTAKKEIEKIEKHKHETIKFRGIFDYNEEDVDKYRFRVLRAFKYLQIVSRALIDHSDDLEDSGEADAYVNAIYRLPQKVIFAIMLPNQTHLDKIVDDIERHFSKNMPDKKIDKDIIRKLLGEAGTVMALNIMNDIAYNATNESTIALLRSGPSDTSNHRIMELMMEENTNNTPEFVTRAIELRKTTSSPYMQSLIAQIARKHIMFAGSIDHRQINRLVSGKVLSANSKPNLLLDKGKRKQD